MPLRLGPEHWRSRAEEIRVLAEIMNDADARSIMMRIASDYERLAVRLEHITASEAATTESP